MSVQLSLFPEEYPPVSVGDSKRHYVQCPLELFPKWLAAVRHYVFDLGGTGKGFKRMFLLRYPIGPTTQDLEEFLDEQTEKIEVYKKAKSIEVRASEAAKRAHDTAEREKQEEQNRWRRTGRKRR